MADPTIEQHDAGEPKHIYHSADTASPEWREARDQYHRHLFACLACYAPAGRYCVTGAELRQRYNQTPMETMTQNIVITLAAIASSQAPPNVTT
jgi:hypothetical protein